MKIRAISSSGDWTFGKGLANYNTDQPAIEQDILTWLRSWVSNCFFALKDGIDWTNLLGPGQRQNLVTAVRQGILQRYGVVGITTADVSYSPLSRAITIDYDVQTLYSASVRNTLVLTAGAPLAS